MELQIQACEFLPTGMVADIYKNEKIYKLFSDTTKKYAPGREIYWYACKFICSKGSSILSHRL